MQTQENQEGIYSAEDRAADGAGLVIDPKEGVAHSIGQPADGGADANQHHSAGDGQREQGNKEACNGLREDFLETLLNPGQNEDARDDGEHRGGIVHNGDLQAKEGGSFCQAGVGGVQQHAGQSYRHHLLAAKDLCGGNRQEDGQEVEGGVGNRHQDVVGVAGGVQDVVKHQGDQDGLQQAACGDGGEDGNEQAGDAVDNPVGETALGCAFIQLFVDLAAVSLAGLFQEYREEGFHVVADDDLILAVVDHQALDTLHFLERFIIDLRGIHRVQTQSGKAMGNFFQVFCAADERQDVVRQLFVIQLGFHGILSFS